MLGSKEAKFEHLVQSGQGRKYLCHIESPISSNKMMWEKKGLVGKCLEGASIEIWGDDLIGSYETLRRPYLRVGFILSVCLSVCLRNKRSLSDLAR